MRSRNRAPVQSQKVKQTVTELRDSEQQLRIAAHLAADDLPGKYIEKESVTEIVAPMQEIAGHTGALLREQKFNTGLVALMQSALRENPSARRFICDADTIRKIGNIARGDHDRFISMFNERKDNTTTSTPTCSLLHVDSFKTGRLSTLFERTISDSMAKRVLEENIVALREVNSHTKTIKDTQGAISDTLSPSIQKNDKKGDSSTE